jgi:hypothetical protein
MTKTEYQAYIASEDWQKRRKAFLLAFPICIRCGLPRWLAVIAYDQDLHVHHKNYARVGRELDDDLEPLCRRCHEVETFGSSPLHKPKSAPCRVCHEELCWDFTHNSYYGLCDGCRTILDMAIGNFDYGRLTFQELGPPPESNPLEAIKREIARAESKVLQVRRK